MKPVLTIDPVSGGIAMSLSKALFYFKKVGVKI
ncbi:hypothetical protein SAMN05446037_100179 [Anaerovirgula multivorans]|uniref:Uncharacterized protein n=1 Tax=Anaerovirgula multivorans TaxID=312168 RepID=A0A238ZS46_9FIRM|nr:hypothetical protein SAMN05446037_100179 [Anaerovirgula multivorans]